MRVAIDVQPKYHERIKALFEVQDLLKDSGTTLQFASEGEGDLLLIEDKLLKQKKKDLQGAPSIVFERIDSSIVSAFERNRRLLKQPQIKYWIKEMVARNPALHNAKMIQGRYHFALLEPDDARAVKPSILVKGSAKRKILPLLPMFLQDRYNDLRFGSMPNWDDRPIDLMCAGELHDEYDILSRHRRRALHLVGNSNLRYVAVAGRVPKQTYNELLRSTKIFVSPYGKGEYSFKDFEAIFAGCLLLKPDSSFCAAHSFDIYGGGYCVQTKPDMSDFREVIEDIYDNVGEYREMAARAADSLRHAFKPEDYAKELLEVFQAAVNS